jgi:phospholipase C
MTQDELKKNVDTIVVVIMENRSFDHVLGHLRSPLYGNRPEVEGIEDVDKPDYLNPNNDGEGVAPFWTADRPLDSDLPHDPEAVAQQLAYSDAMDAYLMTGFVKAFEDEFHTSVSNPAVMGLLRPEAVPATGKLAAQYTVCDNWFACIPTSTAPNRLMSMCGFTNHRDTGILLPDQATVYDWLLEHSVKWRVYAAGLPFFALMPRLSTLLLTTHFRRLADLPKDLADEHPDDWPQVIFIEPDYYDCPVHLQPPCDNHAPLAMALGEVFLAQVYGWLSSDAKRWSRTVLIVTYDEHGGFFDHVSPLRVKYRNNAHGVSFDTTGPRVPAIVAGPFAPQKVSKEQLDNTSILQFIAERFGKAGETYSSEVAGRMHQNIRSVSSVLSVGAGNTNLCDLSAALAIPSGMAPPHPTVTNNLRFGFDQAAKNLATKHQAETYAKYPELRAYVNIEEAVTRPASLKKTQNKPPRQSRSLRRKS